MMTGSGIADASTLASYNRAIIEQKKRIRTIKLYMEIERFL
ncbi:hypothetical protein [Veillonella agrestimuris]|nr:hypothetical protein [Veillonella agrestimuris]